MSKSVKVATMNELAPGQKLLAEVEGRQLAVFNVDGEYYAIEDVCTHDGGPLVEGELQGREIECPRHGARFDVTTGKALSMPAFEPVETFPVKAVGDELFIEIGDGADTASSVGVDPIAQEQSCREALKNVFDPEIGVNIVDLGLVRRIEVKQGRADVDLTLTSPACPAGPQIIQEVQGRLMTLDTVESAHVNVVWDPPWTPEQMTEDAKDQLGIF
jgi:metal-sulfur cluster biosynthetic enzyme/nitrite reductase/ring-hydroxylating ferredoxin subunit